MILFHAPLDDIVATLPEDVRVAGIAVDGRRLPVVPRRSLQLIEWLAMRLATMGTEFTVQEPPELVEVLRALGERIALSVARSAATS